MDYVLRPFQEADREPLKRLGMHVIDWWHAKGLEASLHLVAVQRDTEEIVGQLQAMDAGFPKPSRRAGQCQFALEVAPQHRRRGIGGALYSRVEAFAQGRCARTLYTAYIEHADALAAPFLTQRGFVPLERFCPSYLDLDAFDPAPFEKVFDQVEAHGVRLHTYADLGDTASHRRKLYALEQAARATQPFREVDPYVPESFEKWEQGFIKRDPATIFLAVVSQQDAWVGVVTGLEWYFTGVHPDWRGQGIATALKLWCIAEAKQRGLTRMETENHGDNLPMLAVNRKLGFVFTNSEVACIKRL